jgi:hypothetical protein
VYSISRWSGLDPVGDDARCAVQLARLLDVHRSTVTRALQSATVRGVPWPPFTVDPDTGRRAFATTAFLTWWDHNPRRGPGRPRKTPPQAG